MRQVYLIIFILIGLSVFAQEKKEAHATRIPAGQSVKIDGQIDEALWESAQVIDAFTQLDPDYRLKPRYRTEVRIVYDDRAIYVAAKMFDTYPDSILTQLGNRDDDLNSDYFQVGFDTYNRQQDAFFFKVYASGVQADFRHLDHTFNAIWYSKTRITDKGWTAELEIPYSALRFSETEQQLWSLQIERSVRRCREISQWCLEEKGAENYQVYWGNLKGIQSIEAPLRLSLMPYVSGAALYSNKEWSSDFNGGLDLKYGINESFTLDMILLPDFSQVKSDHQVKNLSAFEIQYGEQRQFFQEAVDLFEKGDLFYSRRIGRRPQGYYSIYGELKEGEEVTFNPTSASLLNATKLSGRLNNGLGLGIFNAVTNRMYAEVTDSLGNTREVMTEPLTNYNIIVLDKAMKNNSSIYFINTNTSRSDKRKGANVSGVGAQLIDKNSTYQLELEGAASFTETNLNPLTDSLTSDPGFQYEVEITKIKGNFQFNAEHEVKTKNWDINDMGIVFQNNLMNNEARIMYKIFEPYFIFRKTNFEVFAYETHNLETGKARHRTLGFNFFGFTKGYFAFWGGGHLRHKESYNYYEPRVAGRYFIDKPLSGFYFGYSSDYRNRLAFDGNINMYSNGEENSYYFRFNPIVRVSDKLSFDYAFDYTLSDNDRGFSDKVNNDSIYFGRRDVQYIENSLNGRYMFRNNLSLGVSVRHYWSVGVYDTYYLLQLDGHLQEMENVDLEQNFNFNAFNVDVNFSWEFAPGSLLNLNYKNEIIAEDDQTDRDYFYNFSHTFKEEQLSRFSLKLVYYLDYQRWFK